MSYTPIEGGLPQNLLDEFRNISLAFARVQEELTGFVNQVKEDIEVNLPPFPDVTDSDAYKDLNRDIIELDKVIAEKLGEFSSRIDRVRSELGETLVEYHIRDNSILGQVEELKGTLLELQKEGSTLTSRIWEEARTRISENGALAERVTLLEVSGGGYDDTAIWAAVVTEQQARIDGDAVLASSLLLLGAENMGGTAFILDQATVYVDPTTSWASWETTLQASIDGKATITQWQEVRDDADGLLAKVGLQLNVNNRITGWALNNDGASGEMVIQVDRFFLVTPPAGGNTPTQIFYADATGVYMDTAFIRNLTVDVLTAGTLSAAVDLTGSITLPTTAHIKSGQTAYNTGTGWWLGHVSGAPRISIGNPTGNRLLFDGTNLSMAGSFTIQASTIDGQGALATQGSADYATQVSGTKPPANATANAVTTGTAAPTGGSDGDLYRRSGATDPGWYARIGGVWYYTGDLTQTKIDGGILTTGFLTLSTGGHVKAGKANYADDATSGFFLGRDGTVPKFNIGSGTQYLRWTGSALQVGGPIISTANVIQNAISTRGSGTLASRALAASWGEAVLSPLVTTGSGTHSVIASFSFLTPNDSNVAWVRVRLRVNDLDSADTYTTPVQQIPAPADESIPCNATFVIPVTWTSSLGVQITPELFANSTFAITNLRLDAVGLRR